MRTGGKQDNNGQNSQQPNRMPRPNFDTPYDRREASSVHDFSTQPTTE